MQVLMHPREFARHFPASHQTESALTFNAVSASVGLAMMSAILLVLTRGDPGARLAMILLGVATAVGVSVCQGLLAGLFNRLFQPAGVPEAKRFHFWHGLNRFTSGFLVPLLPGSVLAPVVLDSLSLYSASLALVAVVVLVGLVPLVGAGVLWWSALGQIVAERASTQSPRLVFAVVMIPVIGVFSGVLGLLAARVLAFAFCR